MCINTHSRSHGHQIDRERLSFFTLYLSLSFGRSFQLLFHPFNSDNNPYSQRITMMINPIKGFYFASPSAYSLFCICPIVCMRSLLNYYFWFFFLLLFCSVFYCCSSFCIRFHGCFFLLHIFSAILILSNECNRINQLQISPSYWVMTIITHINRIPYMHHIRLPTYQPTCKRTMQKKRKEIVIIVYGKYIVQQVRAIIITRRIFSS